MVYHHSVAMLHETGETETVDITQSRMKRELDVLSMHVCMHAAPTCPAASDFPATHAAYVAIVRSVRMHKIAKQTECS